MTLRKLALGAALLVLGLTTAVQPAGAADLGGNCCADLEERIAELETTTARKGNRRMSLSVYGAVHKAIIWHDADVPGITKRSIGDGAQAPTMFGFMGEAKVGQNTKAGFKLEFGANDNADEQIVVRFSEVWLEHAQVGRLTFGHTSQPTDGIVEITLANTAVAAKMLNLEPVATHYGSYVDGGFLLPFDGHRRDLVRYDSPTVLGGFTLSASVATGDAVTGFGGVNYANSEVWDVALRYAGEFGGFKVAAGAGYRDENKAVFLDTSYWRNRHSVMAGSASIMHTASGLFINGAYGKVDGEFLVGFSPEVRNDLTGMHIQGGLEKRLSALGTTTFYGEWGRLQTEGLDDRPSLIGLGVVQAIDAAALDIYGTWRQIDMDDGDPKINVFMGGARIRF